MEGHQMVQNQEYVSDEGMRIKVIDGQEYFRVDDINNMIVAECQRMAGETRPIVRDAQDARKIVDELLKGMARDYETFQANIKRYLEDIRLTRMSVVIEANQITASLKDLRQFFIGSTHDDEVKRLREFTELCERLLKLKESGFLDSVADTLLRLDTSK